MSIPRINPLLMSDSVRANLEKARLQNGGGGVSRGKKDAPLKPRTKATLTPDMAAGLVKSVKVSEDGNEVKLLLGVDASMIPTAQQKGVFVGKDGRAHFFTKAKIAKAEKALKIALAPYAHHSRDWGDVPIEVVFDYYFAYPSSTPKKNRHKIGPMNERPDASNITKGICDAMTESGFWPDDSFINTETSRKRRTTGPACIKITITNLQPKFDALYRDTEESEAPTLFNPSSAKPSETNPLSDLMAGEASAISQ